MKAKKWLALLLAMVLGLSMAAPAFAYDPIIEKAINAVKQQTYRQNAAYEKAIRAEQQKVYRREAAYAKAIQRLKDQVAARENAYWQSIIDQANAGTYHAK